MKESLQFACIGRVLQAMAYGDALGLPYEGLSATRARKLLGPPDRMRLGFGFSTISDDTEHAWLAALSAASTNAEPGPFAIELRRALKRWFVTLPPGIGTATVKACLRMWIGLAPNRCGVRSAGNGPGMRAVALGAFAGQSPRLFELVDASTQLTHRDPRALDGARMLALASALSAQGALRADSLSQVFEQFGLPEDTGFQKQWQTALTSPASRSEVSGFMPDTVCAVLATCLQHPLDLNLAVTSLIQRGGDTDSSAAMAAAIIAANPSASGPPQALTKRVVIWPLSTRHFALQTQASMGDSIRAAEPLPFDTRMQLKLLTRNLVVWLIVIGHALRRALPPYR